MRHDGRGADATREVARFVAWATASRSAGPMIHAMLAEAEQQWKQTGASGARSSYEKALSHAEHYGVPADIADVVVSYGTRLVRTGDLSRATAEVGQVARWADRDFDCALLQVQLYQALGQADAWQPALRQARDLAGERPLPAALMVFPGEAPDITSAREKYRPFNGLKESE